MDSGLFESFSFCYFSVFCFLSKAHETTIECCEMTTSERLQADFYEAPAQTPAFFRLVEMLREKNAHEELVEVLRVRAGQVGGEEALLLYLTIADVWSLRLGMPGLATEALMSAYELRIESARVRTRLELHLEQTRDWVGLARLKQLEIDCAQPGNERGRALLRFGHFAQERLHYAQEAIRVFVEAVKESEEAFLPGLIALHRLKQGSKSRADIVRVIGRLTVDREELSVEELREELSSIPEDEAKLRATTLVQLAHSTLFWQGEVELATGLLEQAFALSDVEIPAILTLLEAIVLGAPESRRALHLAAKLERHRGHFEAALDYSLRELELIEDEDARAEAMIVIGQLQATQLADVGGAAQTFGQVLDEAPSMESRVVRSLELLFAANPENLSLRGVLLAHYERRHDGEGLLRYWGKVAETAPTKEEQSEAFWRRGRVALEYLRDLSETLSDFKRSLEAGGEGVLFRIRESLIELFAEPKYFAPILDFSRELVKRRDDWNEHLQLLSRAVAICKGNQHIELSLELAELQWRQRLEAEARATLKSVANSVSQIPHLRSRLRLLATEMGAFSLALDLLGAELEQAQGEDRQHLERTRADLRALQASLKGEASLWPQALFFEAEQEETQRALDELEAAEHERRSLLSLLEKGEELGPRLLRKLTNNLATRPSLSDLAIESFFALSQRDALDATELEWLQSQLEASENPLLRGRWILLQMQKSELEERQAALARLRNELGQDPKGPLLELLLWAEFLASPTQSHFTALREQLQERKQALVNLYLRALEEGEWLRGAHPPVKVKFLLEADKKCRDDHDFTGRRRLLRRILSLQPNNEIALDFFREDLAEDSLAFYQLLAQAAPLAQEPSLRALRHRELAQLSEGLDDQERAIFHWLQMLKNCEDEECARQAFSKLKHLHESSSSVSAWKQLLSTLKNHDLLQKTVLWELVTLCREQGDQSPELRQLLLELLQIEPNSIQALAGLVEVELELGAGAAAVSNLRQLIKVCEPRDQRRHRLRLVGLLTDVIGDRIGAARELEALLTEHGQDEDVFILLGNVLLNEPHDPKLLRLFLSLQEQLLPHYTDSFRIEQLELREQLLVELDAEEELDGLWGSTLAQGLGYAALIRQGQVLERQERWEEAEDAYLQGANDPQLTTQERVECWIRVGNTRFQGSGYLDGADSAYAEALALAPEHLGALRARLVCARSRSDIQLELELLERLGGLAESAEERVHHWRNAASAWSKLGQSQSEWRALEQLIQVDPLDEDALRRLVELFGELQEWGRKAEFLGRLAGLCGEGEERLGLLMEQASIYEIELQDPAAALSLHRRILVEYPRAKASLEALVRLLRDVGKIGEAVEIIEDLVRSAPELALEYLLLSAELYEKELADPEQAFKALTKALAIASSESLNNRLVKLVERHQLWEDYVDYLEHRVHEESDPDTRIQGLINLAQIVEKKLAEPLRAFHIYVHILRVNPRSEETLRTLEALAEPTRAWGDLIAVYRWLAENAQTRDEVVELFHRVAMVTAEKLRQPESAFDVLLELLDEFPSDPRTLRGLTELAQRYGLWQELVDYFEEGLDSISSGERIAAHYECARIYRDHLQDLESAKNHLLALLAKAQLSQGLIDDYIKIAQDPDDLARAVSAIHQQPNASIEQARFSAELLHRLGQPKSALNALLKGFEIEPLNQDLLQIALELGEKAGLNTLADFFLLRFEQSLERDEALELLEMRCRVLEHTAELEELIKTLQQVLELDPSHEVASARFLELAKGSEQVGDLIQTLETQAERARAPEQRAAKSLELAQLLESEGRFGDAIDWYEKVLKINPHEHQLRRAQLELMLRIERWPSAVKSLELLAAEADAEQRRADLLLSAEIYARRLAKHSQGIRRIKLLLSEKPSDREAAKLLEEILKETQKWPELLSHYDERLAVEKNSEEGRRVLFASVNLLVENFRNSTKALESLWAFAKNTYDPAVLHRIVQLSEQNSNERRRALELLVQNSAEEKAAHWQLIQLLQQQHEDDLALQHLGELLEKGEPPPAAYTLKGELLERLGNNQLAEQAYLEAVGKLTGQELAKVLLLLAKLRHFQLKDLDGARMSYEELLRSNPSSEEGLEGLRLLLGEVSEHEPLHQLFAHELEGASTPQEKAIVIWRRGVFERDKLEQPLLAEASFTTSLELAPDHLPAVKDLADLLYRRANWAQAHNLYLRLHQQKLRELHFDPDRLLEYEQSSDSPRCSLSLCGWAVPAKRSIKTTTP